MKNLTTILFLAILLSFAGCKKETTTTTPTSLPGGPTVTTAEATNVGFTGATLGGNITNEGACTLLTSGVVLGTAHSPTTSNTTIPNTTTTGTGSFTVDATGLLPATTYYARAYAANCKGINYGNEIHFTTLGGTGGGGKDTTYFLKLNFKGVTYIAAGLGSDSIVEADGNRRATATTYAGIFILAASSPHYIDQSMSDGFSFGVTCSGITGTGTYTFNDLTADPKSFSMGIRVAPGISSPVMPTTTVVYNNAMNEARHKNSNGDCITSTLTIATQTLTITQWSNSTGGVISGTFSGTIYENGKTIYDCHDSEAQSFTGSFNLKRN